MVKKLSFLFLIGLGIFGYAQSNYEKDLATQIAKLESAKTTSEFQQSKNYFLKDADRVSMTPNSKKEEWRIFYYASLAFVRNELVLQRENKTQGAAEVAASAKKQIGGVFIKTPDNIEGNILFAQIFLLRSFGNDSEAASNLAKANEYLNKAELADKNNPRIDLVKGEIVLNSPTKLGGNKELARKYFNSALEKFKNYKRESNLDPNWGKSDAEYYLSILK